MLAKTGVPTNEDIQKVMPTEKRAEQGPVAVMECFQKIPCDPCFTACPKGAIKEFSDINDTPSMIESKCTGCGICVAYCPGLAIFVIDYTYSDDEGLLKMPYEYLPLPAEGSRVETLDREGRLVGTARVVKVQRIKGQQKTPVVWLAVPKELLMTVRNILGGGISCGG
ncbi:4Fe-4S binding protein [Metallumcola ferriviriculae]|uniref:4Fe-4S binding protein n=1 Tax=Metallumcola ferriviriculae TaxID=3039180 RepID=A0AAU0UJC0_9FIRM|nr:4Fe-4S binding protein [Desulfitibacteraceae bacterium MK1]